MATADEILAEARKDRQPTADDILAAARSGPKSFTERVGEDLDERYRQAKDILKATATGEQSFASGVLQMGGKVGLGSVFDVAGEGLVSAGRGLSKITPDIIEDPIREAAGKFGRKLMRTPPGQGLTAGLEAFEQYAEENPVEGRNIEAATNVALALAPVKGAPRPTTQSGAGQALIRSGQRSATKNRNQFIDDLVTPKQTVKARQEQVARTTEEGLLRQKVTNLSPKQAASAEEIRNVAGVSPSKTVQGNYIAIGNEVSRQAKSLERQLAALGEKGNYAWEDLAVISQNTMAKLKENPALVGDAAKSAERVIEKAFRLAAAEEKTLAGLLRVRRDLDAWVLKHKPKAFEDNVASNAMTSAAREVRAEINSFIAQRAKGVKFSRSLEAQSNMLRAMDDIAVKAADEPRSIVARAIDKAIKVIPVRNELVAALGLTFGMGGLGAASFFLPAIQKGAIAAGTLYGLGKVTMSPNTRKLLGEVITIMDKSAQKITDPAVLQQMRADKAALLEIIRTAEEGETEEDQDGLE